MSQCPDIRDSCSLAHEDVVALNFMRDSSRWVFRRFHRQGLRSQILEMLNPEDLHREIYGVVVDGVRHYPRARPQWVMRIFRHRFAHLAEAFEEAAKITIVEQFFSPDQFARSSEFLVEYRRGADRSIVLCGLQEYVDGVGLDPWGPLHPAHWREVLPSLDRRRLARQTADPFQGHFERMQRQVRRFVVAVKKMIHQARVIPDLAGRRNLLVTVDGRVRLVDINNLSRIEMGPDIQVDDKGYPMCDKSVEALYRLEKYLLATPDLLRDPLYARFLQPERMRQVAAIDRRFHLSAG